jgi:hypothetical protein
MKANNKELSQPKKKAQVKTRAKKYRIKEVTMVYDLISQMPIKSDIVNIIDMILDNPKDYDKEHKNSFHPKDQRGRLDRNSLIFVYEEKSKIDSQRVVKHVNVSLGKI